MTKAGNKRSTFSTLTSVLLVILFVAAALCIGSVRGWNREREKAVSELENDTGLVRMLQERGMDAANLTVVAARHLPADDTDLILLQQDALMLTHLGPLSHRGPVNEWTVMIDADMPPTASRLCERLLALPSVQASPRDQTYIVTLSRTLTQPSACAEAVNNACDTFNRRMSGSLTGRLAMLLGVEPLSYVASQEVTAQ